MGAYKINTTADPGRDTERAVMVAKVPAHIPGANSYAIAEEIARHLSRADGGHYWITTVTAQPLTSFTGGQRDPSATGGTQ